MSTTESVPPLESTVDALEIQSQEISQINEDVDEIDNDDDNIRVSNATTKEISSQSQEGDSSEWGWDHTPIESDDSYERPPLPLPQSLDTSFHSTTSPVATIGKVKQDLPLDMKEEPSTPPSKLIPKHTVSPSVSTPGELSKSQSSSQVGTPMGLSKGMISSPSFNELEKAIGQTLAMGLNTSESSNSLNSEGGRNTNNTRVSINR
jgi:hypothetical protein